jgi:SpoVK/Ycf46/Vps4 family AAA+-type ATPase
VAQVLCTGFVPVDSAELVGEYYGESEAKLRKIFADARGAARRKAAGAAGVGSSACGVVLFFDEVDALCAKREQAGGAPHCAPGPMLGRVGRWLARPNRCELEHAERAHICAGEMERRLVTTFLCEMDEFLPGDKVVTD